MPCTLKETDMKRRFSPLILTLLGLVSGSSLTHASEGQLAAPILHREYGGCKVDEPTVAKLMYLRCQKEGPGYVYSDERSPWQTALAKNRVGQYCVEELSKIEGTTLSGEDPLPRLQRELLNKLAAQVDNVHKRFGGWQKVIEDLRQNKDLANCDKGYNRNDSFKEKYKAFQLQPEVRGKNYTYPASTDDVLHASLSHLVYTELTRAWTYSRKLLTPDEEKAIMVTVSRRNRSDLQNGIYDFGGSIHQYHGVNLQGERMTSRFHPQDRDGNIFPDDFYDAFAAMHGSAYGSDRFGFQSFDKEALADLPAAKARLARFNTCLKKNYSADDDPNALVHTLTEKCSDQTVVFAISRGLTPISKSAKDRGFFDVDSRKAVALAWFREEIGLDRDMSHVGSVIINEHDTAIFRYLTDLKGWSKSEALSEISKLQELFNEIVQIEGFSKDSEKKDKEARLASRWSSWLASSGFDLMMAMNIFKLHQFKATTVQSTDVDKALVIGLEGFKAQMRAQSLSGQIRNIVDGQDLMAGFAREIKSLGLTDAAMKTAIAAQLKVLKRYALTPGKDATLDQAIRELDSSTMSAREILAGLERRTRVLGKVNSDSLCSVVEVKATKRFDGASFQQKGVVTVVKTGDGKTHWITPAHVVFGADTLEANCGGERAQLRVLKVDSLRDVAEVEPLQSLPVRPLEILPFPLKDNRSLSFYVPSSADSQATDGQIYRLSENSSIEFLAQNFVGSPYLGVSGIVRVKGFGIRPGMSGSPLLDDNGHVVAILTHTANSTDHSLALPVAEFLKSVKPTHDITTTLSKGGTQLQKTNHLRVHNKAGAIVAEFSDACPIGSFSAVSQWGSVSKTDWGGGSGFKRLTSGRYLTSRGAVSGGEAADWGRFLPDASSCEKQGVLLGKDRLVGVMAKGSLSAMPKDMQIDSVISLAQLNEKAAMADIVKNGVWVGRTPLSMLCEARSSSFTLGAINGAHSTTQSSSSGAEAVIGGEAYDLPKLDDQMVPLGNWDLGSDDAMKTSLTCGKESLRLRSQYLQSAPELDLTLTAKDVTGFVKLGECEIKVDHQAKDYYQWTLTSNDLKVDFAIETYPSNRVRAVYTTLSNRCFPNSTNKRIFEHSWTVWESKK
jgi:S1-C subfamily serine protease